MANKNYINGNYPIAVIGAGHGGMAMAGHLALLGYNVNMYDTNEQKLSMIKSAGGIHVTGKVNGFGKISLITSSVEEVIYGVEMIMVVVPALAHKKVAESVSPFLKDGQIIILHPGKTLGAFEFKQVLIQQNVTAEVIVAEAQTFIYASRTSGPAQVQINSVKQSVPVACIRTHLIPMVLKKLNQYFTQFIPGENIFKTSFENIGSVFHPAISILNAGWIEDEDDFAFYKKGVTESVSRVLEAIDLERIAVANALGVKVLTAEQWFFQAYGIKGTSLYETMGMIPNKNEILAPKTLLMRYLEEDVPCSLVPISAIGKMFGVTTPAIDSLIQLASLLNHKDYMKIGRTVDRLGLSGMNLWEIRTFALGERIALSKVI